MYETYFLNKFFGQPIGESRLDRKGRDGIAPKDGHFF